MRSTGSGRSNGVRKRERHRRRRELIVAQRCGVARADLSEGAVALGGVTLTLALTRAKLPASIAYGVDLLGAAAGCALVIPLLDRLDAPSAVLVSAGVGAMGACCFALAARRSVGSARPVVRAAVCALSLAVLGVANSSSEPPALRPS